MHTSQKEDFVVFEDSESRLTYEPTRLVAQYRVRLTTFQDILVWFKRLCRNKRRYSPTGRQISKLLVQAMQLPCKFPPLKVKVRRTEIFLEHSSKAPLHMYACSIGISASRMIFWYRAPLNFGGTGATGHPSPTGASRVLSPMSGL